VEKDTLSIVAKDKLSIGSDSNHQRGGWKVGFWVCSDSKTFFQTIFTRKQLINTIKI
jgi:hypothetical protein